MHTASARARFHLPTRVARSEQVPEQNLRQLSILSASSSMCASRWAISSCGSSSLFSVPQRSTLVQAPRRSFRQFGAPMPNAPSAHRPTKDGSQQDAEITSPNSFQAVPSNFATRADKKVCGESDEVAAAPPCVATAIARWRLRRKGISKQGGTCHGQRSG